MCCLFNNAPNENSTVCTLCELFKTKHERICNQPFHNRLKYLKCPQNHEVCSACLLLFMENQIAPCNLFVFRPNFVHLQHTHFLSSVSFLPFAPFFSLASSLLQKSGSIYPDFPRVSQNLLLSTFIHSPVSPYLLPSLLPSVQWRASGWSGGRGRDAA